MRRPFATPASVIVFACSALAYFSAIVWSVLQPYPYRYNAILQAAAFAFATCVCLLLNRLFLKRRAAEEGLDGPDAAERRSALGYFENIAIYTGGLILLGFALYAAARMEERMAVSPVYFVRVNAGRLNAAFAGFLALYFLAGFLSRLIVGIDAAPGNEKTENARAVVRIALVMLAAAGIAWGILANVTVVWGGAAY